MRNMIRLGQVEAVHKRLADATTALLGDTIMLSDADWRAPSKLPSWSRAKVAVHLSRNADALRKLTLAALRGEESELYPSRDARLAELERGLDRSGLDLQIDLDTTAGALHEAFGLVSDWRVGVRLPTGRQPLAAAVVVRLHEVLLHHLDLKTGFGLSAIDPVTASWLLQWACIVIGDQPGLPAVELTSEAGVQERLGSVGPYRPVSGSDVALWGWITGRTDGEGLAGAQGLVWPLFG